ncbi:Mur ligase [Peziza echinospora]|nr:Mur ligase [Peziza echinospora]
MSRLRVGQQQLIPIPTLRRGLVCSSNITNSSFNHSYKKDRSVCTVGGIGLGLGLRRKQVCGYNRTGITTTPGRLSPSTSPSPPPSSSSSPKLYTTMSAPYPPAPPPPPPSRTTTGTTRNYASAIQLLNTLQTNHAILAQIRESGRKLNALAIPEMRAWVARIGYTGTLTPPLNIIHIAGTKGKGSVCAFTSHILAHALTPLGKKVGLYTSPHLRSVRERIQINNKPISKYLFAKYFFDVWDRLEESAELEGRDPREKPVYFRYLTLMAFHVYIQEGVDVVVLETGIGGEYDSTNVVEKPLVTGIARLAVDHVAVLGETREEIAWHKAGIMKAGAAVYATNEERQSVRDVLEERAREKGVLGGRVMWVPDELVDPSVELGLKGDFQRSNAALAVVVSREAIKVLLERGQLPREAITKEYINESIALGLQKTVWPGRCQLLPDPVLGGDALEWCLDGAHTPDSLPHAAKWFLGLPPLQQQGSPRPPPQILLFNQQTRDPVPLLTALHTALPKSFFTHIIFSTNVTYSHNKGFKPDLVASAIAPQDLAEKTVQQRLREVWIGLEEAAGNTVRAGDVVVCDTLQDSVERAREIVGGAAGEGGKGRVLVTGSLHLVGGVLEVLAVGDDSEDEDGWCRKS